MPFDHPTTTHATPVTPDTVTGLTVGDNVLIATTHADATTHTPATIKEIRIREVQDRSARTDGFNIGAAVGHKHQIITRDQFDHDQTINIYDTDEALDATYPHDDDRKSRALAAQSSLYVPTSSAHPGSVEVTLTPVYGSQVYVPVFVPHLDPDRARALVEEAIRSALPHARMPRTQARLVADMRVNIFHVHGGATDDVQMPEPVAMNVLKAESVYFMPPSGSGVTQVEHPATR